jgi:tetratricopeptide (TPR) repeat protein
MLNFVLQKGKGTYKPFLTRMPVIRVLKICFFFCLAIVSVFEWSCQSDARTTSRIPPVPGDQQKKEWQKDAMEALTNLINRKIDQDENYYKRARLYFLQENYPKALEDINAAIRLENNIGAYYLLRGKVNRELNKVDEALEDAQRAEVLQQDSPELYVLLADVLQEKNQYREAQRYMTTAMQMAPYEGQAYYVKGMIQNRMSDTTSGLGSFIKAIELNPRMLRAYQQISRLYSQMGDSPKALYYNQVALNRYPNNPELHLNRGNIYLNAGKLDSAVFSYRRAVRLDSSLVQAHFELGNIYAKWKSYPASLSAYQNVLKYQPDFPRINYLVALDFERLGNDDKAAEYYTKEGQINPDDPTVTAGLWRIQNRKMRQYDPAGIFSKKTNEPTVLKAVPRTLDTSRIKIAPIQPRRSLNMGTDSTRKIIIK